MKFFLQRRIHTYPEYIFVGPAVCYFADFEQLIENIVLYPKSGPDIYWIIYFHGSDFDENEEGNDKPVKETSSSRAKDDIIINRF